MDCTTLKPGISCVFMSKKGCSFNGGACHQVIDKCEGCNRIIEFPTGKYCSSYPDPASKWKKGNCNLATHLKTEAPKAAAKINPLKASKRGAAGR
ncbi:MAG: PxxKW family cysteine-rich protein [Thermodesulfobacteriota bacterium]|nr:PxxKW family cysteine-rich protein [Thermodesulfobacteriota bacterium]